MRALPPSVRDPPRSGYPYYGKVIGHERQLNGRRLLTISQFPVRIPRRMELKAPPRQNTKSSPVSLDPAEQNALEEVCARSTESGSGRYLPLRAKFALSFLIAALWVALSVWLSLSWVSELGEVTSLAFAVIAIAFIAYVPGFMNAFLLSTLLFDRQPRARVPGSYPGLTVLVAAYNEESAIRDTLESLALQNYPGR